MSAALISIRPVTPLLIDFHEQGDTEMKMRVMLMLSMGAFLLSTTQANAGLFDLFSHDDGCCKPKPKRCCSPPPPTCCKPVVRKCCNPAPRCCNSKSGLFNVFKIFDGLKSSSNCCKPAPRCCKPKPVCCKPKPVCCKPKPTCCTPKPACSGSGSGSAAPKAPLYEETPAPPKEGAPTPKAA